MSKIRIAALIAATALGLAACGAPNAGNDAGGTTDFTPADVPDKPSEPVTLNIIDVAGNLQLTQGMIDEFVEKNPDIISEVTYSKSTSPELAGKIKAQQQAGRVQIGLVLTGTDALAAGIEQDLWLKMDDYADKIGDPNYLEPAADMQKLAQGYGQTIVYYPSGPILEYNPKKLANPPTNPQALLEWAKANPNKFQYARPANSGPGRTFVMGLPYLLGDTNPEDPESWTKTWDYLKELGKYIDYYPTGTTETMKNLGTGTVDIIASTTGWDINPRALGTVPADVKVVPFENMTWVTDAQYAVIPKGVSADVVSANIALIKWILTPEQQAKAYDSGYFYPGPAVKDVTIDMAPQESQEVIAKFGRPEYEQWIEQFPKKTSLPAAQQVAMFDKWDREVGAGKYKTQ